MPRWPKRTKVAPKATNANAGPSRHIMATPPKHDEIANRNYLADFDPDIYRIHVANPELINIGRLTCRDKSMLINKDVFVVGRNTSTNQVDFCIGECVVVSRRHFSLIYDGEVWSLECHSKRGIYINGTLEPYSMIPYLLSHKGCCIRFPETGIKLYFESFIQENNIMENIPNPTVFFRKWPTVYLGNGGSEESDESDEQSEWEDNDDASEDYSYEQPNSASSPANIIINEEPVEISKEDSWAVAGPSNEEIQAQLRRKRPALWANNPHLVPPKKIVKIEEETPARDPLKPGFSYAQLIVQSISSSPIKKLTLSEIYAWISDKYEFYGTSNAKGWQNSIRHNLSLNKFFLKIARRPDECAKGSFWKIDPAMESKLVGQCYRKRKQYRMDHLLSVTESRPIFQEEQNSVALSPLHLLPPVSFHYGPRPHDTPAYVENVPIISDDIPTPKRNKRELEVDLFPDNSYDCSTDSEEYETKRRKTI